MDPIKDCYDKVSRKYADAFFHELDHKPLDRDILKRFAALAGPLGTVCDLGCGPGTIASFLQAQGAEKVMGIDLSPGMIEHAKRLSPDIPFQVGSMLALESQDECFGGICAFYAIVNLQEAEVRQALKECYRTLKAGGYLLLSFHIGEHQVDLEQFMDEAVAISFYFYEVDPIREELQQCGFRLEDTIIRYPYPNVEFQSRRAYILAKKPETASL